MGDGPRDSERGIVPQNRELVRRAVWSGALIQDEGFNSRDHEAVCESRGYENLSSLIGSERERRPVGEAW